MQSDTLKTDVSKEFLDIESGQERVHRDGVKMYWGTDKDAQAHFSGNDLVLNNDADDMRLKLSGTDTISLAWTVVAIRPDLLVNGVYRSPQDLEALDSAPSHSAGRLALASPTWDPDGDGNGELVMSDGSAWQEVVDLPNYT